MKLYAISDLHLEQPLNREWLHSLPRGRWRDDVLLVAGDVAHGTRWLEEALVLLRERFARVLFVPGNHELWHADGPRMDGVERLERLLEFGRELGVDTGPVRIGDADGAAWVVSLHAWYAGPGERESSLWVPEYEGEPWPRWRESLLVRWPDAVGDRPAHWMLARNEPLLARHWDAPVITFSHFLPRRELMMPSVAWTVPAPRFPPQPARRRRTRFSLIAGCSTLDMQIRKLGATLHVYGHQHRNRRRRLDGVTYRACCLGHPRERYAGQTADTAFGPVPVWCSRRGVLGAPAADRFVRMVQAVERRLRVA